MEVVPDLHTLCGKMSPNEQSLPFYYKNLILTNVFFLSFFGMFKGTPQPGSDAPRLLLPTFSYFGNNVNYRYKLFIKSLK